jgi:aromatic ring-opening dioxygenase catalytic subunit (LigB family)
MKLPSYFVSHGGGPWAYMEGEFRQWHAKLESSLADIPRQLAATPKTILMISGHWEEKDFTVMANPNPPMLYDYSGFPENTYRVQYSVPGFPALARRVQHLLQASGFDAQLDASRGFDHGAFVPLSVMYPKANVPVVQLSLRRTNDPGEHIEAGRALAPLRDEGVLIVGSGLSYHNLRRFSAAGGEPSRDFDRWLNKTLVEESRETRIQKLIDWKQAPSAREAHPHEDHLLPLMVVVGAAEDEKAESIYHQDDFFGALAVSSFRFGI